jgi:non-lysosomal glucosylceramidase
MRKCNCSGNCGANNLNRREFLGLVGAGAAATLLAGPAWGAFELPADELQRWRRELFTPAKPRLYLSGKHTDARMHLGGIGTGNFEIGVDGQFTTWQLFNTLRDGQVPLHFLIRAGGATRLLQTAGGPDWPRVQQIEMTGEYPVAVLRFRDTDLPVQVELTAFSPFAPLDARFSAMPLAAFVFRIKNPTKQKQTVSLAALMQNPVGYDAAGPNN